MVTEYVLCYVQKGTQCLLIKKNRPKWQAGMLNLPGGKIEPGETPQEAAKRELEEETGLKTIAAAVMGRLAGDEYRVYVVHCLVATKDIEQKTDEEVFWMHHMSALSHPRLHNNLRVVLPLLRCCVAGWTLWGQMDDDENWKLELPCVSQPT